MDRVKTAKTGAIHEIAEAAGLETTTAQIVHPAPVFFHPVDTLHRPWVWLDERIRL